MCNKQKKMKKLILIYLLFASIVVSSQSYTEVVQQDTTSKEDLYSRARTWAEVTFNSAKDVIQMGDKETGTLIVKAALPVTYRVLGMNDNGGHINYTLTIEVKPGRYRYSIDGIQHILPNGTLGLTYEELKTSEQTGYYKRLNDNYIYQIEEHLDELIESLKVSMLSPRSDW